MDIGKAILYVLAVLAIMVVAGLIVYVLSGIVVSIIDKKNVTLFGNNKEQAKAQQIEPTYLLEDSKQEAKQIEQVVEEEKVSDEPVEQEGVDINLDLAESEKRAIEEQRSSLEERERAVNEEKPQDDVETEDDINDLYQKLIAEINAEALEEGSEEASDEDDFVLVDDDLEEPHTVEPVEEVEENVDTTEEVVKEEIQPIEEEVEAQPEEVVSEVEESVEEVVVEPVEEVVDTEKEDLKNLVAELRAQLEKEQAEKDELAKLVETAQTEIVMDTESLENLNARRDLLKERLALAEKDLKANKKEYVPLLRIKKNLETDKAKLRRKEAVVAKQKVVLFGVNNYVVDPEKQKKLSEDLDVLNALRLSVQHCEDVMKENEDRYPILEKTNGILTKQVADLKADLEDIEARIEAKSNNDDNADNTNE